MKNLKSFTETLKSAAVLAPDQQKEIKGGYYYSYEECDLECQSGDGSWGSVPAVGGCYEVRDGIWDCMDS